MTGGNGNSDAELNPTSQGYNHECQLLIVCFSLFVYWTESGHCLESRWQRRKIKVLYFLSKRETQSAVERRTEAKAFLQHSSHSFIFPFFFPAIRFLSASNTVVTCCDQTGGTNWVSTLTHNQNQEQGRALRVTKEAHNGDHSIRLNRPAMCIQINRFVRARRVPSTQLCSVAKLLHRPRWRVKRGRRGRGAAVKERGSPTVAAGWRWRVWRQWMESEVRQNDWMWEVEQEKVTDNNNLKIRVCSSNLTGNLQIWKLILTCLSHWQVIFSSFVSEGNKHPTCRGHRQSERAWLSCKSSFFSPLTNL